MELGSLNQEKEGVALALGVSKMDSFDQDKAFDPFPSPCTTMLFINELSMAHSSLLKEERKLI